jgi:hypothetical protein
MTGYGFNDGYRLGLGVRGGYALPANVYLGGAIIAHEGGVGHQTSTFSTPQTDVWFFSGEVGYELSYGRVTFRPYLGAGYALVRESFPPNCVTPCDPSTRGRFAIAPAIAVLFSFDRFLVGVDGRYFVWTGDDYANAPAVFATVGLMF